jgi:predicted metal-dependent phosphotriesterase family hydrolase
MNDDSKARDVITVLGTIRPEQMRLTYTHEHLFLDAMDHYGGYEFVIDDEDLVAKELHEFISYRRTDRNEFFPRRPTSRCWLS